jgi:hypothetical protein
VESVDKRDFKMDDMSTITQAIPVTKLCEGTWNLWKFQTKVALKAKDVYSLTTGETKVPDELDWTDADAVLKFERESTSWVQRDNKAQAIIVRRLDDNSMNHLITCDTSKQMWDKLLTVYERRSDLSLHLVQQQFFNYKYKAENTMSEFISGLETIVNHLKNLGEELSENMQMTKILMSLPDKYKYFIAAWDSVNKGDKRLSELTSRLLIEEERMKGTEVTGSTEEALVVNNQKHHRYGKERSYPNKRCEENKTDKFDNHEEHKGETRRCYYCKKEGHIARYCRFRQRKESNASGSSSREHKNAFIGERTDDITALTEKDDEWFLDSGATSHMTGNRALLNEYREFTEKKSVKIGDGSFLKSSGIGKVVVHAYDGTNWIPSDINEVLFVPELKPNLFSLSAVLDKGHTAVSDKNETRLMRDNKTVAIAERSGNMFKMMFGKETEKCLIGKETRSITWWHKTLGHQNVEYVKCFFKRKQDRIRGKARTRTMHIVHYG